MYHYEQGFRELQVIFEASWTIYKASCERLLQPLAISEVAYDELIQDPSSKRWNEISLHQKLKIRLGPSYESYKSSTEELHKKIDKLRRKLKLTEDYNVSEPTNLYFRKLSRLAAMEH